MEKAKRAPCCRFRFGMSSLLSSLSLSFANSLSRTCHGGCVLTSLWQWPSSPTPHTPLRCVHNHQIGGRRGGERPATPLLPHRQTLANSNAFTPEEVEVSLSPSLSLFLLFLLFFLSPLFRGFASSSINFFDAKTDHFIKSPSSLCLLLRHLFSPCRPFHCPGR